MLYYEENGKLYRILHKEDDEWHNACVRCVFSFNSADNCCTRNDTFRCFKMAETLRLKTIYMEEVRGE